MVMKMRVNIVSKKENPLLGRQDIEFEVRESNVTPSRKELRAQIAAQANADEKNLVVDVLRQHYGTTEVEGNARIYKGEKDLKRTETNKVLIRNFGKGAVAKKAKAPPKAAEAAPAPEKK